MRIINFKKAISFLAVGIILSIFLLDKVSAHTVYNDGGETYGWKHSDNGHALSKTQNFFFVYGTAQYWKDRFNYGDAYFYDETGNQLNMVNASAFETNNYVEQKTSEYSQWVAQVVSNTSGQHKTSWHMQFNGKYFGVYSRAQWNRIAEHEIGHVFGLGDLEDSGMNGAKLMYGSGAGGYTELLWVEEQGLKEIWGY